MTLRKIGALIREPAPGKRAGPTYGRVFFELRARFDLSTPACLLADVVDTLSKRTGWCFASRAYLAGLLGVSVRTVKRLLASLRERGLVEHRPGDPRQVRPTERWHRARLALDPGQNGTYIIR